MATAKRALGFGDRQRAAAGRWAPPTPRLAALRGLVLPALLLLAWQGLIEFEVYSRGQLPAPLDVVAAARELTTTDTTLWEHVLTSLRRVLLGFAWGGAIAILIGLAVGLSRTVEAFVAPTMQAIRAVPSLAWGPLLLLWLGLYEAPKLTLVAIGAFFPVYTNLVAGIRQIDRKLIEVGRAYGLRGPSLVTGVLVPASLPSLLTGLRLGLAQGWLFLVAAELIAASQGLGFLLLDGSNTGRVDISLLALVLLALLGQASDWGLGRLETRLLRWSDTFRGGT